MYVMWMYVMLTFIIFSLDIKHPGLVYQIMMWTIRELMAVNVCLCAIMHLIDALFIMYMSKKK